MVSGHAYTLISVHEIAYNGNKTKLVKLRNPVYIFCFTFMDYLKWLIKYGIKY